MKNSNRTIIFALSILISNMAFSQDDSYDLLFLKGDYEQIFEKSQALLFPQDYYWNSIVLDKRGETLKALEVLVEGTAKFQDDEAIERLFTDYLYKIGQYYQAKPLLEENIDKFDNFIKYIYILEFQSEYGEAIELLIDKILNDSLNLEYLSHLGDNYYQIEKPDSAITIFSKILSINPNDQLTVFKLANIYLKKKNYLKTIETCETGLSIDSTNIKLIQVSGIASFNLADFKASESCFKYINEQGDSSKFILKHLGISEFNIDSMETSKEHLLGAFHLDSSDIEVCFMLGKVYMNTPNPARGLYFFDRADSLFQPDHEVFSTLYIAKQSIYSKLNDHENALMCYQKAFEYNPKPEFIYFIGSLYQYKLNNNKLALEYYTKFLSLLPEEPEDNMSALRESQMTISLRRVAEKNISTIKEELFFNGELE